MMKKLLATFLTASIVCAILTSPLALAQLPKATAPAGETTVLVQEVKVEKKEAAPAKKDGAAPFEAMKNAMMEVARRKAAQPRAEEKREAKPQAAKEKQAVRAMIKRAMPRVVRPNLDAQVQQFTEQFRPILRAEYHIVRVACRLTPEQRRTIARAAEQALRDAARKYLETMQRPMTVAQRASNDPRKLIQEGLSRAVKAQLPAEQAARYHDELARRNAGRKQATIRNLVAKLDHDLILSAEQRDKLGESLSAHWDDTWCQSLEMLMHDYAFLPPIPDQYITPYLNESQKRIWWSTQKVQGFFGGMVMMGGMVEDDGAEDKELRAARLAAANGGKPEPTEEEKREALMRMELIRAREALRAQVQGRAMEKVKAKPQAKTP